VRSTGATPFVNSIPASVTGNNCSRKESTNCSTGSGHPRPGACTGQDHGRKDNSDLADARFTVERARLEASKQSIVSPSRGKKQDRPRPRGQKLKVQEATVAFTRHSDKSKDGLPLRDCATRHRLMWISGNRASLKWRSSPTPGFLFLVFGSNYSQGWMNASRKKWATTFFVCGIESAPRRHPP